MANHLQNLIKANGNVGGTIHQFNKAFNAPKSIAIMTSMELSVLGMSQTCIYKKCVIMAAIIGKAYPERINWAGI